MGLFTRDENVRAGKTAAKADRRAGGFANACDGTGHDMTPEQEEAFNKGYRSKAPRAWYRQR